MYQTAHNCNSPESEKIAQNYDAEVSSMEAQYEFENFRIGPSRNRI
jgi:hypothetical protein